MKQPQSTEKNAQGVQPLSLKEVAEVLVKHHGLNEGLWEVSLEFQVAIGKFGPSAEVALPGVISGVSKIGLVKAGVLGPDTVDAAAIKAKKKAPKPAVV